VVEEESEEPSISALQGTAHARVARHAHDDGYRVGAVDRADKVDGQVTYAERALGNGDVWVSTRGTGARGGLCGVGLRSWRRRGEGEVNAGQRSQLRLEIDVLVKTIEKGLAGGAHVDAFVEATAGKGTVVREHDFVVTGWNVGLGVGVAVWGKIAEGIGPDIGVTVIHGVGVEGFVVSGRGGFVDGGGGA